MNRRAPICRVCESEPFCLCVGRENEWDECICVPVDPRALRSVCRGCSAPTVTIDFETGEPIPA